MKFVVSIALYSVLTVAKTLTIIQSQCGFTMSNLVGLFQSKLMQAFLQVKMNFDMGVCNMF